MVGRLQVLDGSTHGAVQDIGDSLLLGRASDCDLQLRDITVSREHARISRRPDGRYQVEDLGSNLGTTLNGNPVLKPRLITDRDVLQISKHRFVFRDEGTIEAPVSLLAGSTTHILRTLDASVDLSLVAEATPTAAALKLAAARLHTIYAVAEAISSILDMDELLREVARRLLAVFPKAERCFVLLRDADGQLVPRASRRRGKSDNEAVTVSRTVLDEAITRRQAVLSHDAREDARFKSGKSVANYGIRAVMAAPLMWREETLGILYLDSVGVAAFASDDLELLLGIARQSAAALGNARLHEELLKRQRLEQDLQLAERIQQSFLPRSLPTRQGYDFFARYEPAFEVGGDFYDVIQLPNQRLGIVIGDVSGKGVSAALFMARLSRDLRFFALTEQHPSQVLSLMNQAVLDFGQDDMFITLVYAVLDPVQHDLQLASAGHMPVLVRHSGGEVSRLDDSGLPLGVLPGSTYETKSFRLDRGDTAFLYTDGVVEAMNSSQEMFGMDRLEQALRSASTDPETLLMSVLDAVRRHVQDATQFDDTTAFALGRRDDSKDTPTSVRRPRRTRPR